MRLEQEAIFESLARRARPGERPEELLFDLRLVSEREHALEIAARAGLPFAGLRGFDPDPALFTYLPLAVAVRERLCPLALDESGLRLASAYVDPDLSYLEQRFPSLELELTISPRTEILQALHRVTASL